MVYISFGDAAKKWCISERRVRKRCEENRIMGVVRFSRMWLIPKDAEKPKDGRKKNADGQEDLYMDFSEKLQRLRKEKEWTQEQLAEELFVSRTAISKWESGKGYPNIESLKNISKLFSVSIDDLLSGEELISLAEDENRSNMSNILSLIFGILDLMALSFLFLPLFGQPDGDYIRAVNLFAYNDASDFTRIIYFTIPVSMAILGVVELILQYFSNEKWLNVSKIVSVILQALAIFVFINTHQPYATSLVFMFFMIKVALLIKESRMK